MIDDPRNDGGRQGSGLAGAQDDEELGSVENDGVDAGPLLEEGGCEGNEELRPEAALEEQVSPGIGYGV